MNTALTPNPPGRRTARCPGCGWSVSVLARQTSFCPHCGRRMRVGRRGPIVVAALMVLGLGAGGAALLWHGHDVIAVSPVESMLADDQAVRLARAADLDHRAAEVRVARQRLLDGAADLSNLSGRITTAIARADDEGRWPAMVAGRSLDRADAGQLVGRIKAAVTFEQRAIARDSAVLGQIATAASTVHGEVDDIAQLRQRLAADPTHEQRTDIERRAQAYRAASSRLPDAAGLVADPAVPVDSGALLR